MKKALTIATSFILTSLATFSQNFHPHYLDGELYVKLKNEAVLKTAIDEKGTVLNIKDFDWLNSVYETYNIQEIRKSFYFAPEIELQQTYRITFHNISATDNFISYLEKLEFVEYAEKVPLLRKFYTPNDMGTNSYTNGNWALFKIDAQQAWDISTGSTSIKVAVVDDAVQTAHPDLAGNMLAGRDVADGDNDPNPPNTNYSHGTHVAGIVSGATNNGTGVASIGFNTKIVPVKSTNNVNTISHGYEGVAWARTNGAHVINMSWGGSGSSSTGQNVINAAYNAGITLVAAAGNDNVSTIFYPAGYTNVIAVGSTGLSSNNVSTATDAKSTFSNYGSWINVSAPGTNIRSTVPNNSYAIYDGTSMASPLVAGLCGLILSVNPNFTPTQVRNCILSTADDLNPYLAANRQNMMGSGRINALAALQCAQASMVAYDASLNSIISPAGSSCNANVIPQITIRNNGTNALTSCTIRYNLNGGTALTYNWTGNLPSGNIANITLPAMTATAGSNIFTAQITGNLNGNQADAISSNNSLSANFSVINPSSVSLPFVESFESNSFSTNGWSIENPDNATTWAITTTGGTTPGNKSAKIDFYNYNAAGQRDAMITPFLDFTGYDTIRLSFEHAYKRYPSTASDSLIIYVSTNCGATYQRVASYGESGAGTFATAAAAQASFTPSVASDWCVDPNIGTPCFTVNLSAYKGNSNVLVKFEAYNAYSNNLFIDNINIWGTTTVTPGAPPVANFNSSKSAICQGQSISFTNVSSNSPTSYSWDIQGGSPATSTLANPSATFSTPGTYTISLTATNAFGSNTTTKSVIVNANPTVTGTANPSPVCIGEEVILNGTGATSYSWNYNGSTMNGNNISTTINGANQLINLTGTDANGCTGTAQVSVVTFPAIPTPSITNSNGVLQATLGFSSYQWYKNNMIIPGATSSSYTTTDEGNYHVKVTDINGCESESAVETIKPSTGINENSFHVNIFPNPSLDIAYLKWENINDKMEIRLLDITGKTLALYTVNASETSSLPISMGQFASGIYLVKLTTLNWNKTIRLIKK